MDNIVSFPDDETPTKPVNDAGVLLRIRRIARLAHERLTVCPDEGALDLARTELEAIECLCAEALR